MDCFADNSRRIEDINDTYFTPEEYIDDAIDSLKNATAYYRDIIPRWYKQPEYTEVWTEKDAMVGIFKSVLADRQVRIVPNKGFTGMGFVHENLSRLALIQRLSILGQKHIKKIHILYFGDHDPSGDSMDKNIKDLLELGEIHYGLDLDNITFERIAL